MVKQLYDERKLSFYRRKFFPLIRDNVVTGYNVYKKIPSVESRFAVDYLHSELGENDAHRGEFFDLLKDFDRGIPIEKVSESVVDRDAVYETLPEWENPEDMRFFDVYGNPIPRSELLDFEGRVIGESLQYDLAIPVEDERQLLDLIDVFNKKLYGKQIDERGLFKLDESGKKIINEDRLPSNPWEIPLIVIRADEKKEFKTFQKIDLFQIWERGGRENIIQSLCDKESSRFEIRLKGMPEFEFQILKRFVNNLFVSEYINP